MQKILIETNQELSEKLTHVFEVNRFKAIQFDKGNQILLYLSIESCQLRLLMNLLHRFIKSNLFEKMIFLFISVMKCSSITNNKDYKNMNTEKNCKKVFTVFFLYR